MLYTNGRNAQYGENTALLAGALAGYAIYLLVAWIYVGFMAIAERSSPDTYLPFVWPFMSPFLVFRYSWEGPPLVENLLSLLGGLLMVGGALWGFLGFPRGKIAKKYSAALR
jgi:hypothetical protein